MIDIGWDAGGRGVSAAAVACRELTRCFGEGPVAVEALRGVSTSFASGTLTAIMGHSGSGKSTLMHLLAGLDRPTSGEVWLGGTALTGLDDADLTRLRRRRVGFVFQSLNLIPVLSAEENVVLPARIAGEVIDRAWLEQLLLTIGLQERRRHRPGALSGGEQQRVAIARALIGRPAVVFADEPTGNLDSRSGEAVLDLLRAAVDRFAQTVVLVTHDPRAAARADRILFIADGRVTRETARLSEAQILDVLKP